MGRAVNNSSNTQTRIHVKRLPIGSYSGPANGPAWRAEPCCHT
jgi:hypothetical protein